MAAEHERPTVENVRRHMDDDPCVICGAAGHTVWDNCGKLASPLAHDSPISKIFGKNNAMNVRAAIRKYVKEPQPAEATKPATVVGSSTKDQDLGINGQSSEPAGDQVRKPADAQTEADTEQRKLHEAIAQAPTGLDGLKKVRDISQGEAVQTVASDSTNVSESVKLGEGNTFNPIPSLSKAGEAKFALRKELSISSSQVFTNHFEISFKPKTEFFVYEVLKMPTGKSKRKSRFILKTAIEAWDFLRDNKQHFTTDNVNTIIAWKNLHRLLDTQHCVVEGKKNTQFGAVWMPNAIADGTERLQLFLKLHRKLDLDGLAAYIDASRKSSVPDFDFNPIVWALNLAITSSLSADNVFQQSTNKFFVKNGHKPLTGGQNLSTLCTIRGYYYTIKPAMQKVLLKVNPVTSAFYRPITVSEYLTDTSFEWEERIKLLRTLTLYIEPDRKAAEDQVEQDRVDNLNKPQNRIKKFFDFGPLFTDKSMSFAKGSLNDQGQWVQATTRTRVIDHMKAVFGKEFNDKKAAINVGTAADPIYYPAEYLRIMPYQIYKRMLPDSLVESMLEQASHIPTQSRRLVEIEAMQCLGLDPKQGAQEFPGCSQLLVTPTMLKIPSTQMGKLNIVYGAGTPNQVPNANAQWDLRQLKAFLDAPGNKPGKKKGFLYALLVEEGVQEDTIQTYMGSFGSLLTQYGVCGGARRLGRKTLTGLRGSQATYSKIRTAISNAMQPPPPDANLTILLLKSKSVPIYCAFKDVMDRSMHSLCLTEALNFNQKTKTCNQDISLYMANVMMKANLKFGGGNHTVQLDNKPNTAIANSLQGTLVLGADLTHPSSSSLVGCPSIAAVVGSVNSKSTKYLGSMRLQRTCKKEIIDDLKDMVVERIRAYISAVKVAPTKILFYRDGVSTGQFEQVRDYELPQVKEAWREACPGMPIPKITLVVAVKRHHTRFYPISQAHKNGNCAPGTLVDSAVVSPHYSDFYLQSHHGLKGTAIPTHYVVVTNEIGLKEKELQELTWKMCYTYVRATVGVSYAPPAYYADRLCERGRAYLRDWFSPEKGSDHYQEYESKRAIAENTLKPATQAAIALLPTVTILPGRNAARKSAAQKDLERAFGRNVDLTVEDEVLKWAREEFETRRNGGVGPWARTLDGTMFWM